MQNVENMSNISFMPLVRCGFFHDADLHETHACLISLKRNLPAIFIFTLQKLMASLFIK
jgi:hypothetical protein